MKVLLYFEGRNWLTKSGLSRAHDNQKRALEMANIEVTTDIRQKDYDILLINTYGTGTQKLITRARKANKKVVIFVHSTEEDFRETFTGSNLAAPLYKKYLIKLYAQADLLIAPTQHAKEILHGYGLRVPITILSNGVNLPQYQPNSLKEEAFRQIFSIKRNEKVIISVGFYFDRKGVHDFIEIAKQMPQYRFIWIGKQANIYTPKHIKKMVKNSPSNVEFPGYIKGDILEGAFSGADCFFFPSYEETEGIVVLEALASRQKILVRDIPAYHKWLTDEKNCLKGKNNADFQKKIEYLVNHPCKEMKEAAYQVARERSIPAISESFAAVFKNLLRG
ncbi:1,2-diacylglycerol-3-alpha-glucose alpha-1,2-glucosyltransferase [Pilibacter termitis]|uniref:1,2-diacylglycerol-3-alpha-glucose alpha-1,2-glucosyltransferase n=1 Tax=Pilibacter termitis TaxID=263852 RepID=A0A1T4KH15_9ENTE|nr:glycosyltransferase family 4 protein [Pilibacter termitis]SJZ41694.1 1,2-diacylglycerol-3-alpha-glucose alpha-1,2-glucosyltransferase [Pilibacter termitis]